MVAPKVRARDGLNYIRYDSTVDNMENPAIFVVYNDSAAYPEYLVTFN